jgi:hypothetical protein
MSSGLRCTSTPSSLILSQASQITALRAGRALSLLWM